MRAKVRFRDWPLFHKLVAAGIAAMVLSIALRAVLVIDGAFEQKLEFVVKAPTVDIWPWIIENDKRSDWEGEILRVQGLSNEVGRNRFLYWKRRYKQWRSYEVTTGLVQERLFKTERRSDFDKRWWQVELEPSGPCETQVRLREVIQPLEYQDRFWFFRVQEERQVRLENSAKALKRWVGTTTKACTATPDKE